MARNLLGKIWDTHSIVQEEGCPELLAIDVLALHEVTSPQAFLEIEQNQMTVRFPARAYASLDHSISTGPMRLNEGSAEALRQIGALRNNSKKHGVTLFDMGSGRQGIIHVIGPELGLSWPGTTIVCGDSHTATHGAFGALAFGVGTSEVAQVMASGCMLQRKPKCMQVFFKSALPPGVSAKDLSLYFISQIGTAGGTGYVLEYSGECVRSMSMEERMTLCNMSIECGARAGMVAPDSITFTYLEGRRFAPKAGLFAKACRHWQEFASDSKALYDAYMVLNVANLEPMITWGTSPEQAVTLGGRVPRLSELPEAKRPAAVHAMQYMGISEGDDIKGMPVDWAFLGSCTNGRIEDLRAAGEVLRGRKVHRKVTFYVVPGSEAVMKQAVEEGLDRIFKEAGADFRMPGCSLCLSMNDDRVPPGKRCISSSNRNFIGRQGTGSRTHLASPATVAASAVAGCFASAKDIM